MRRRWLFIVLAVVFVTSLGACSWSTPPPPELKELPKGRIPPKKDKGY
ncbi:MAG: hypothetical protein NZO58_11820 [Gemmataceae bacterium]|nr:hypothetical protein [Gemmataceae bacterium]